MTGWHSATAIHAAGPKQSALSAAAAGGRICREASDLVAMTANLLRYWFAADSSVEERVSCELVSEVPNSLGYWEKYRESHPDGDTSAVNLQQNQRVTG
jgi:hypothetical protein